MQGPNVFLPNPISYPLTIVFQEASLVKWGGGCWLSNRLSIMQHVGLDGPCSTREGYTQIYIIYD